MSDKTKVFLASVGIIIFVIVTSIFAHESNEQHKLDAYGLHNYLLLHGVTDHSRVACMCHPYSANEF